MLPDPADTTVAYAGGGLAAVLELSEMPSSEG
jgi:hypothetical protein